MADVLQTVTIPEEDLILLNRLQLNNALFTKRLAAAVADLPGGQDAQLHIAVVDGGMRILHAEQAIMHCTAQHLGNFGSLVQGHVPTEGKPAETVWTWNSSARLALAAKTTLPEELLSPLIVTLDPMLVSFILAHLTETLSLEHVLTREGSDGVSVAYGLRNIVFVKRAAPGNDACCPDGPIAD